MNTSVKFLISVWAKHTKPGEYVFISTRDPKSKKWRDHAIQYRGRTGLRKELTKLFKQYNPEKYDLYWCPLPYKQPKRGKKGVPRTKFLWQDLDEADPKDFDKALFPTIYWESSPGRYHGLWQLEDYGDITEVEKLNRDLAHQIGADKSGWDLGQVLRIPGTRNHKYDHKPLVKLKHNHGEIYDYSRIRSIVKEVKNLESLHIESRLEEKDPQEVLNEHASKLPRDLLTTLMQREVPVGKRSDMLWNLEHRLYEHGLTPDEIFTLIKYSAWNKYKGRHDEDERLQTEISKVISQAVQGVQKEDEPEKRLELEGTELEIETYSEMMSNISSYPGWLVEGFWARRSHGIVAGEPKSFKSTFTLDLAVSVASGEPFLGKYPVDEPGPVLIIQNENNDWLMKDKTEKIITNRRLVGKVKRKGDRLFQIDFPRNIPLYFINQKGYLLNNPEHQEALEKIVKEIKPVLVILDPLYLMFDGDVNSAKELNPILNWLLKLKTDYKTGVMVIHHYNKGGGAGSGRPGQRMLGSTTLHGWIESAWYLQVNPAEISENDEVNKVSEEPQSVIMTREFRTAGSYPQIELKIKMGKFGEPVYQVGVDIYTGEDDGVQVKNTRPDPETLSSEIIKLMGSRTGAVDWTEIKEHTGVKDMKLIREAAELAIISDPTLEMGKKGLLRIKEE